jgi:hypothetical protein
LHDAIGTVEAIRPALQILIATRMFHAAGEAIAETLIFSAQTTLCVPWSGTGCADESGMGMNRNLSQRRFRK